MKNDHEIHMELVKHLCEEDGTFKIRLFDDGALRYVVLAPLWEEHPHAPIATITIEGTSLVVGMPRAKNVSFDIADPKLSPEVVRKKLHEAWRLTKDSWDKS